MYLQFPFAQPVRHRRMAMREFVARAETVLGARDDCLLEASDHGLTLLARNEEALAAPCQVLREVFTTGIDIEPIRVRLAPGTPPLEPIMHVRVEAPSRLLPPLRWTLRRRRVVLLEEDTDRARVILRGEGQAARLLGLGEELSTLGNSAIRLWVALSRYVPLGPEVDGAGDGNLPHV